MIKGARKQMIVVRTGSSRYFDEAYFVLREERERTKTEKRDMLSEANRLLLQFSSEAPTERTRKQKTWLAFALGGACGGALTALIAILLL